MMVQMTYLYLIVRLNTLYQNKMMRKNKIIHFFESFKNEEIKTQKP